MGLEDLQHFYHRIGQSAVISEGGLWLNETRLSLMTIPGVLPLRPSRMEVQRLLRQSGKMAAVFGCGFETGRVVDSFWVRDRDYGLHSLQRQFRQQVKAAQQVCICRPVDWGEMAALALPVNRETFRRRGRGRTSMTEPDLWLKYCHAAAALPGYEVMGCFVQGELAAYMVTWVHEGVCFGLHMFWSDAYRAAHPTHALYYETVRERMVRPGIEAMTVGRQSIPAMTSVDRFKGHAGFVREPCRVGIVLHPAWSWLLANPLCVRGLRALRLRAEPHRPGLKNLEVFEVASETRLV